MPKEPSLAQQEASRRNISGQEGPRTAEGKLRSSQNGKKNRGTKTAKARARILEARWGLGAESLYAAAGCLTCSKMCRWPSFSIKTAHGDLPIACLQEVLEREPRRCPYNVSEMCWASVGGQRTCLVDTDFLEKCFEGRLTLNEDASRAEKYARLESEAKRKELEAYLAQWRKVGPANFEWSPRAKHIARYFGAILRDWCECRFQRDHFEDQEELGDFLMAGASRPK